MTQTPIQVTQAETTASEDDRFHRFSLIAWWDQKRLARAKVLVIGAGALGNELVKNLALLGVGNVLIADMDRIENSNLSRSVLYREANNGMPKAQVAAEAARQIYPDINAHYFDGNISYDMGLGVYEWADIVLAGLDNREARLAINRACWLTGTPWIDGAIEQIQGIVRLFDPSDDNAPCYECTMSETDWKLLQMRRSCNLLSRQEMVGGKTPTTPTISSIIAGIQAQEAVKVLHGMPSIAGKGMVFNGLSTETWPVEYQRNEDCHSHCAPDRIVPVEQSTHDCTVGQLLEIARQLVGNDAVIDLPRELISELHCTACGETESIFASLGSVSEDKAVCPKCDAPHREVRTIHKITNKTADTSRTMAELGLPAFDMVVADGSAGRVGILFDSDRAAVLGPLMQNEEAIEWL